MQCLNKYGWNSGKCLDAENKAIPWLTYPCVEYLKSLDFSDKTVFEWGSGSSTEFWSTNALSVISVEDNREWYELTKSKNLANVTITFEDTKPNYYDIINKDNMLYDIIVVDGNWRLNCAINAVKHIRDTGFIIVDNTDWENMQGCRGVLQENNLIEVIFAGYGPINSYAWWTSIFFSRAFTPKFRIH